MLPGEEPALLGQLIGAEDIWSDGVGEGKMYRTCNMRGLFALFAQNKTLHVTGTALIDEYYDDYTTFPEN